MAEYARLIEIFEQLVAYPTITGDKQAASECLAYVENILAGAGLLTSTYSSNGFDSLIATTHATQHPKVLLQAHLDVVPGSKELFTLQRVKNKLVGRGAYDMKYAAACFLLAVEELKDELHKYDLGLMFTTDEEANGLNGVKYLLDQGYGCDICILPDGGDNWRIEIAAKGGWAVQVTAQGTTAHASRPWEGDNAIDKVLGFVEDARQFAPSNSHTDTTLVLSKISGGKVHNQVPDEASATLDFRFMTAAIGEKLRADMAALAKKHEVSLTDVNSICPIEVDVTLPEVVEWDRVVTSVRGEQPDGYALSFGASDARYFAEKGIPSIVTRPDGGGHHSNTEWIDETGLYEFYKCIKAYVQSVAGRTPSELATGVEKGYTEAKLPETVAEEQLS